MKNYTIKIKQHLTMAITFKQQIRAGDKLYELMLYIDPYITPLYKNSMGFRYEYYINQKEGDEWFPVASTHTKNFDLTDDEKHLHMEYSLESLDLAIEEKHDEVKIFFCQHEYYVPLADLKPILFKILGL